MFTVLFQKRLIFVSNVKHTVPSLALPEILDNKSTVIPEYFGGLVPEAPRLAKSPDALVPYIKWSSAKNTIGCPYHRFCICRFNDPWRSDWNGENLHLKGCSCVPDTELEIHPVIWQIFIEFQVSFKVLWIKSMNSQASLILPSRRKRENKWNKWIEYIGSPLALLS